MSRSVKGAKGAGYEYWSRRTYKDMTRPGQISKKITRRHERRQGKQEISCSTKYYTTKDAA